MPSELRVKLDADLKDALRGHDALKSSVIRMVMSAVRYAEVAQQKDLDDAGILGVMTKEVKQREESIEAFKKGNRPDLVSKEEAEMAILKAYLPAPASRDEIVQAAKRTIAETGAKGPQDRGKVMPKLVAEFKGKADGKEISNIVMELLSS